MRPAELSRILDREFLSAAEGHHTPVMLWGPPGVGKSQLVAQVAERHAAPMIDIRLSQMEPSDLRGIPFRSGERVDWAVPSMLPDAERHGASGVLFLDEINAAPPVVSAAAYQLILDRRLGDYRVPPGWAIFAAGNRQGDRGVTYSMPAPLANRFAHFTLDTHLDDWVSWAHGAGIDARLIAFLRFRPDRLFAFDPAHNPVAFPTPRSWEFAHRALCKFGEEPELLRGALQACVGDAAGIELAAFIESLEQLPDLDAILAGVEVEVPAAIDLQYAVASALVARARQLREQGGGEERRRALGHIIDYAGRFAAREMGVMLVADLHRALGDELFEVPAFAPWARLVSEVMFHA